MRNQTSIFVYTSTFLVLATAWSRAQSAGDVPPAKEGAYRKACKLVDLRRPAEAIEILEDCDSLYAKSLFASLLGNMDNRMWGLRECDVDRARTLALDVIPALEKAVPADPEAAYLLGCFHSSGIGTPENAVEAARYFQLAADRKHAMATCALSVCHYYGKGVPVDQVKARKACQRAVRLGSVNARFNLGLCFAEGLGVKKNDSAANSAFEAAAKKGHTSAMWTAGLARLKKSGSRKGDTARGLMKSGVALIEQSARAGNSDAMFSLAEVYRYGIFVERDWQKALNWYSQAAQLGQDEARAVIHSFNNADIGVVWSSSRGQFDWIYITGEATNLSGKKLDAVLAVASFYAEDGTLITSDFAMLEFSPLMPDQSSPFKIMTPNNPHISKARIAFKLFGGQALSHFDMSDN